MKRGNTAAASTYTGPLGELVVDTGLQTLRIQDGSTPGGWVVTGGGGNVDLSGINNSITAANTRIQTLSANVGSFYTWANANYSTSSTTNSLVNGDQTLTLNSDGTVTMPLGSVVKAATDSYTGISTHDGNTFAYLNSDGFFVNTLYNTTDYAWQFDNTGKLTLPASGIIQGPTDGSGASSYVKLLTSGETRLASDNGNVEIWATAIGNSAAVFNFRTDGSLTLPDGSNFGNGGWNTTNGIALVNHDTDFSLSSVVMVEASGQAILHSQNDSGTIQLSVTTDSLNNVITIVNNSNTWTFGADGFVTIPSAIINTPGNNVGMTANDTSINLASWNTAQSGPNSIVNLGPDNVVIAANVYATEKQWTFDQNGNLTIPTGGKIQDGNNYLTVSSINIQGQLKGVDGSTGTTGQVLTRQSNGGVAWADATGGGGNLNGGVADNSAGITITTYTLQNDQGQYDNSGSVTYNIRDAGATAAGVIINGLTVSHTQTITGGINQGDNVLSWSTIDYQLWEQVASITAYVTDSRGYTFYTVVQDMYDVPHGPCLVEGTMITMANGTHKAIEDITHGELIRVWNFDLGEFTEAQPIWIKAEEETTGHDVYTFSDGTQLRTVGHHVFNKQAGAFTKLKHAETPVGTTTFNEQGLEVTLISKERVIEPTRYYNVWTQYHLNLFADGILTSNRFNNIYPIVDMKFVKDDRALRSVEEFAGIDEKYIIGLRLQEQTYSVEYIQNYVHNRLERTDISNILEQGI